MSQTEGSHALGRNDQVLPESLLWDVFSGSWLTGGFKLYKEVYEAKVCLIERPNILSPSKWHTGTPMTTPRKPHLGFEVPSLREPQSFLIMPPTRKPGTPYPGLNVDGGRGTTPTGNNNWFSTRIGLTSPPLLASPPRLPLKQETEAARKSLSRVRFDFSADKLSSSARDIESNYESSTEDTEDNQDVGDGRYEGDDEETPPTTNMSPVFAEKEANGSKNPLDALRSIVDVLGRDTASVELDESHQFDELGVLDEHPPKVEVEENDAAVEHFCTICCCD